MNLTRYFNNISFDLENNRVIKTSEKSLKGEIEWLENQKVKDLNIAPDLYSYDKKEYKKYTMSYFTKNTLFDYIVSNDSNKEIVSKLFSNIYDKIYPKQSDSVSQKIIRENVKFMYKEKIFLRLDDLLSFGLINKTNYTKLKNFTKDKYQFIKNVVLSEGATDIFHGDLHLGNILFDEKTRDFKLIDARWFYKDSQGIGDVFYDCGKLLQCVYGGYGYILNKIEPDFIRNEEWKNLIFHEIEKRYGKDGLEVSKYIAILLLFSCAPLHKENTERVHKFINKATSLC